MVFVPMAQAPPKAGAKELLYKFDRWVYILVVTKCKGNFAGSLSLWTSVFFRGRASNSQDSPKASPRAIFKWKNSVEPLQLLSNDDRWGKLNANMRQYVPLRTSMGQHWSLSAVQKKTAFVEQSWWPELNLFGSMRWCSFPWHTWHNLLLRLAQKNCCINLIDEFTSLLSPNVKVIFAASLSLWTSVFFRGRASNSQDSPKASPRAIFKWKNSVEPLQLLSQWMTGGENWMPTCANMCHYVPAWANIAVCQLCRKRQPLWSSHDGLNLTCLDQCDGVRSPGISSSQGRRKRIVVESEFDPWVYILVSPKMIYAGLPRKAFPRKHAFVDISVFWWLGKQRPRFAQGQPKGNFQWKNLIEPLKPLSEWMKGGESWTQTCTNVCLYVPAWANIAVCQLCRERQTFVEQSWWPELNVFGSMPWCSFPRHILLPRPAQKNCMARPLKKYSRGPSEFRNNIAGIISTGIFFNYSAPGV